MARDTRVSAEGVSNFALLLARDGAEVPPWDVEHHYTGGARDTAMYHLVLDAVNFCFFALPGRPRWETRVSGKPLSGYHGVAIALKDAVLRGVPLLDPEFLARITTRELARALGGEGGLPLMDERAESLRQTGKALLARHRGEVLGLIAAAQGSAVELARLLAREIPSFNDTAALEGFPVVFYKRAQLFAADLAGAFGGKGPGAFHDLHALTCFADYKLPQVLRQAGVLEYSPALANAVDQGEFLSPGSAWEVEIRACAVQAIRRVREALLELGIRRPDPEIDWLVWNLGQDDAYRKKPYHRVLTVFY
jgi:hypothetical protein